MASSQPCLKAEDMIGCLSWPMASQIFRLRICQATLHQELQERQGLLRAVEILKDGQNSGPFFGKCRVYLVVLLIAMDGSWCLILLCISLIYRWSEQWLLTILHFCIGHVVSSVAFVQSFGESENSTVHTAPRHNLGHREVIDENSQLLALVYQWFAI